MNNTLMHETVQRNTKKKFGKRTKIKSKVQPRFPNSSVREYERITRDYAKLEKEVLSKHLAKIIQAINQQNETVRHDDTGDISKLIDTVFFDAKIELQRKFSLFNLSKKINKLASIANNVSVSEWKRICRQTLGIDIFDDYYKGEYYRRKLEEWANKNVSLIKNETDASFEEMHTIVKSGFINGKSTKRIVQEIKEEYGFTDRRCRLIARDQMAKLNADLTKKQQESAGVKSYEWSTSGDVRVRDRHSELDGKVFKWDDPPVVTEPGKPERRCHPGEDYQCRCVAIPIFDYESLDLPMSGVTDVSVKFK